MSVGSDLTVGVVVAASCAAYLATDIVYFLRPRSLAWLGIPYPQLDSLAAVDWTGAPRCVTELGTHGRVVRLRHRWPGRSWWTGFHSVLVLPRDGSGVRIVPVTSILLLELLPATVVLAFRVAPAFWLSFIGSGLLAGLAWMVQRPLWRWASDPGTGQPG